MRFFLVVFNRCEMLSRNMGKVLASASSNHQMECGIFWQKSIDFIFVCPESGRPKHKQHHQCDEKSFFFPFFVLKQENCFPSVFFILKVELQRKMKKRGAKMYFMYLLESKKIHSKARIQFVLNCYLKASPTGVPLIMYLALVCVN